MKPTRFQLTQRLNVTPTINDKGSLTLVRIHPQAPDDSTVGYLVARVEAGTIDGKPSDLTYAYAKLFQAAPQLALALEELLAAESLTPGDCYDKDGNPNENWGAIDRAKTKAKALLAKCLPKK